MRRELGNHQDLLAWRMVITLSPCSGTTEIWRAAADAHRQLLLRYNFKCSIKPFDF